MMDWSNVFTIVFLIQVLNVGVRMATPLVFTAIGEIFAERSGVFNLGVEGIMLFCGFIGFSMAIYTENLWLGVLAGTLAGILIGLLFAFVTITLCAGQIVSGLALLILGNGVAIYFYRIQFGHYKTFPQVEHFRQLSVPFLSDIPLLGPILFEQNILTFLMFALVLVSAITLAHTRFGLRIDAVGEFPAAADTAGVNVRLIRYICVVIGGALAGLGGCYFTLAELGFYSNTMIGGRGFIALALVVFARWNPILVLVGGFLFGVIDAIQIRVQLFTSFISPHFLIMMPYILTVIVMIFSRSRKAPSAITIPYERE